jgi:hypothetical protein
MMAGTNAAHLAHTGKSNNGTNHGRPDVVTNVSGIFSAGNATPLANLAHLARRAAVTTPIVGAKLDNAVRIFLVKNVDFLSPFNIVAMVNVDVAQSSVINAFGNGPANEPATSDTASTTKIALIKVEKISSVNLVKYLTRLDADVNEEMNSIAEVHNPVHAYNGKKGTFIIFANCAKHATKANTGPVEPMIVNGCALVNAYMNPQAAVELTISIVPMAPFVATSNKPPNPTAGAKHAKNKKQVAARH